MPHDGGKHIHDKQADVLCAVTPSTDEGLGRSAQHGKGSGRKRTGSDARRSLRARPTPGRQTSAPSIIASSAPLRNHLSRTEVHLLRPGPASLQSCSTTQAPLALATREGQALGTATGLLLPSKVSITPGSLPSAPQRRSRLLTVTGPGPAPGASDRGLEAGPGSTADRGQVPCRSLKTTP